MTLYVVVAYRGSKEAKRVTVAAADDECQGDEAEAGAAAIGLVVLAVSAVSAVGSSPA